MNYFQYKRLFPGDVLVYVEEFNKQDGVVLFDFVDSNEYNAFIEAIEIEYNLNAPTMVLLNNYNGRIVQENTIYSIKIETIQYWSGQISLTSNNLNSFLIGYAIDVTDTVGEVFSTSVSLNDSFDYNLNYYVNGGGNISQVSFLLKGHLSITVRNVGQGNWNEVSCNDKVKIVYDAGASMNASKADVINVIGNRCILYNTSKPILILSHWDKDHYHALLKMTDTELRNCFSAFICRNFVPNLTSRMLFGRLSSAVGPLNTITIPAAQKPTKGGPTYFRNINPTKDQIVLYNAQHHKNRNISGLILSIKSVAKSIILSGDAHYEQISRDILPHLNYDHKHSLVVPHHGGNAGKYIYKAPQLMKFENAIISVGSSRYKHPFTFYVTALKADNFSVFQTNIAKKDITINL